MTDDRLSSIGCQQHEPNISFFERRFREGEPKGPNAEFAAGNHWVISISNLLRAEYGIYFRPRNSKKHTKVELLTCFFPPMRGQDDMLLLLATRS